MRLNINKQGIVVWITGLPDSGKTTIAKLLIEKFISTGIERPILLDGDQVRRALGDAIGHSYEDRKYLAQTYARLAALLASQDKLVICATVSMFEDVRQWSRAHNKNYFEVYLNVPRDIRQARDTKGIYKAANDLPEFSDASDQTDQFEPPTCPDLIIDNFGTVNASDSAETIWKTFYPVLEQLDITGQK